MAILTAVGIILLCLGYFGLLIFALSSKPEQVEKNKQSILSSRPVAMNQTQNRPSNPTQTGTPA